VFVHGSAGISNLLALYKKPPIDPYTAIEVVATINRQPFMIMVDVKSPYKSLAQLTEAMLKKGEKATYGVAATVGTVVAEIYKARTGIRAVEVNYKMAQDSLNDMASGNVDFGCHDPVFALSQQREGRLRILAVASAQRLKAAPDFPTMREAGYAIDLVGWFSAMVPAATPKPIVEQINKWFNQILAMPETQKFLTNFGGDPWISTPEEGQARLLKDIKDWEEYVRVAKLKPQG